MRKIDELKMKLKEMGLEIRKTRTELKETQKKGYTGTQEDYKQGNLMCRLNGMKYTCRHHHIAYSELRGKTREKIEKPRENNYANESEIKRIKALYAWEIPIQVQEAL
jgi:hypothetical protein